MFFRRSRLVSTSETMSKSYLMGLVLVYSDGLRYWALDSTSSNGQASSSDLAPAVPMSVRQKMADGRLDVFVAPGPTRSNDHHLVSLIRFTVRSLSGDPDIPWASLLRRLRIGSLPAPGKGARRRRTESATPQIHCARDGDGDVSGVDVGEHST